MPETTPSAPVTKRLRANSKGEELYFIHLQRTSPEDAEDDHDDPPPRQPKMTVGEELFNVHLKRSQGLEPDFDVDPDVAKEAKIECQSKARYNLRSNDKKA